MSEITSYIAYYIAQPQKTGVPFVEDLVIDEGNNLTEEEALLEAQKLVVREYISARHPHTNLNDSFVEYPENKRTNKWPALLEAIAKCRVTGSTLLIAELGLLTNNEYFTKLLLDSKVSFYCCDQPFVNETILEALCKHSQVQRKLHGKLIREGLKLTSAKSGNPNAAEVISKVNKPKIDTAIIFAFLLIPIIKNYRNKGYSQRQMVKMLNEEGFTAPEGGKWVLSQLQKVLDRVKLNEIALKLEQKLNEFKKQGLSVENMVEQLNAQSIPSLKRGGWNEGQLGRVLVRIKQIDDIISINKFILTIVPLLNAYSAKNLNDLQILTELQNEGFLIKAKVEKAAEEVAA